MLQVENVIKYFGGVHAVDGVSFSIKPNKITALIGPNGSGKSTLFNLISGVLAPDRGKIVLDGKEITAKPVYQISNLGISRIFQHSRLFNNLTLRENLLLAFDNNDSKFWSNLIGFKNNTSKKDEKIIEVLKLVGLENKLHVSCRELSFGQKRLVEISRAILKPHKLLMLDEPVAGVTPALRDKISDLLLSLEKKGETILLIEHDMNFTLGIADEVIVLDEGKIIAKGAPKDIKKNKKVLEAYLGE